MGKKYKSRVNKKPIVTLYSHRRHKKRVKALEALGRKKRMMCVKNRPSLISRLIKLLLKTKNRKWG